MPYFFLILCVNAQYYNYKTIIHKTPTKIFTVCGKFKNYAVGNNNDNERFLLSDKEKIHLI